MMEKVDAQRRKNQNRFDKRENPNESENHPRVQEGHMAQIRVIAECRKS